MEGMSTHEVDGRVAQLGLASRAYCLLESYGLCPQLSVLLFVLFAFLLVLFDDFTVLNGKNRSKYVDFV